MGGSGLGDCGWEADAETFGCAGAFNLEAFGLSALANESSYSRSGIP